MVDRLGDWIKFNIQVIKHIIIYVKAQYENEKGDDQASKWSSKQCVDSIERYINRFGSNTRGPKEQLRDLIKVSHYSQIAYDKLKKELNEGDVY